MTSFDPDRLVRLAAVMDAHVADDRVGGIAWLVDVGDDLHVGAAGVLSRGATEPVRPDSLFRIASITKPVLAAGALLLVEECAIRLDDPVDDLLPELAGRRVLLDPRGPIDGPTRPARRPILVRDVFDFRLGWGMDFEAPWPQPLLDAMSGLGLGDGPPAPQGPPEPDEWLRRLATLPLLYEPGERWLYNTGSDVLGVLVARAAGRPLDRFLRERVFEPLGMTDTGFWTDAPERLGSCYVVDPAGGAKVVYDAPGGQWATPPAFPSGAGGLLSTIADLGAFGRLLLSGGRLPDGSRLLSPATVAAMTTDQLGVLSGASGPSPDGSQGWGLGVGVQVRRTGPARGVGAYGWDGGLGSSWANDPTTGLVGVVLTTDAFTAAYPPPGAIQDFWTGAATAVLP